MPEQSKDQIAIMEVNITKVMSNLDELERLREKVRKMTVAGDAVALWLEKTGNESDRTNHLIQQWQEAKR